ncbi:MAG: hypothetical protein EPO21_04825 [Chloroflexota bacterium]|nr:MAG: hypothetical protein EPO21_04825 [Chloroflexota bacterium]
MAIAQRPLAHKIASTFAPINFVSTLLLVAIGVGIGRVLIAERFGTTLLLVGALIIVPIAVVVVIRPRLGLLLLFITSLVIIEIKRLAWTMEVGLVVELIEGLVAIGLAVAIVTRRDLSRLSSPLTTPVLIYVAYQFLIAFHPGLPSTQNVLYALRDVVNLSVPFFAALYLIRTRRQLHFCLYLWLATAVALALYGLKQHYLGLNYWESAWVGISPTHRLYGQVRIFSTLGSADNLGMHMALSIVLALAAAFQTRNPWIRYGVLSTVPLFAIADLYTLTRGAYLAVLVGILALGVITRKRALLLALAIAAALAIGWYQFNQGSLLANRVVSMFSPEQDESYAVRQDYLQEFLPVIMESPFGLGPATSGRQGWVLLEQWAGVNPELLHSMAGIPTDNYYFRIALENGWVGFLLFVALLTLAFWAGLRVYLRARSPGIKWIAAALLASYAAMAVSSWSNNYFSQIELKLFFWFSMGILMNLPLIESGEEKPLAATRPAPRHRWAGGARQW